MPNSILSACKKIAKKKTENPDINTPNWGIWKTKIAAAVVQFGQVLSVHFSPFCWPTAAESIAKTRFSFWPKGSSTLSSMPAGGQKIDLPMQSESTNQRSEWMNGGIIQAEPPAFPLIFTFSRLFCNYSLAKLLWSITFITQRAGSEVWRITRESQWLSKPSYLAILYFLEIFQSN